MHPYRAFLRVKQTKKETTAYRLLVHVYTVYVDITDLQGTKKARAATNKSYLHQRWVEYLYCAQVKVQVLIDIITQVKDKVIILLT